MENRSTYNLKLCICKQWIESASCNFIQTSKILVIHTKYKLKIYIHFHPISELNTTWTLTFYSSIYITNTQQIILMENSFFISIEMNNVKNQDSSNPRSRSWLGFLCILFNQIVFFRLCICCCIIGMSAIECFQKPKVIQLVLECICLDLLVGIFRCTLKKKKYMVQKNTQNSCERKVLKSGNRFRHL